MNPGHPKSPLIWHSDPLLGSRTRKNGFAQTPWDKAPHKKQDAWRSDAEIATAPPPKSELPPEADTSAPLAPADGKDSPLGQEASGAQTPGDRSEVAAAEPAAGTETASGADAIVTVSTAHIEHQVRVGRQQGYVQGLKDGMAKTLLELQADRQAEKDLILQVSQELGALQKDPFRLFQPLRKLSLHIAEQLVRGELALSGQVVDRLVKACLAEITLEDEAVMVYAHPQDLDRVRPLLEASGAPLKLVADPQLLQGSVRVRSNDTVIEDLIKNRLESLARKLMDESDDWIRNTSSLAGLRVETVEPAAEESPMAKSKFDVVDVEDKTVDIQNDPPEPTSPEV